MSSPATRISLWAAACCLALAATPSAFAQTTQFQIRVRQDQNVFVVPNGATLNLAATGLNKPVTVTVTVIYQGQTSLRIAAAPEFLGNAAFTFTKIGDVPLTLQPNESFNFDITYSAVTSATASAQINMRYTEPVVGTGTTAATTNAGVISLNLAGTAPELAVSYALQANSNVLPLATGATILFPQTPVNTSTTATLIIVNRGSGNGNVDGVTLTGDAFQALGLPLFPATIATNSNLQFIIRYSPTKTGTDTGTLEIRFPDRTFRAGLEGSGTGSKFSYELTENGASRGFVPNETLNLADTTVGQRNAIAVQVRNTGNADGIVNAVTVSGTGYSISDAPFLPATLLPNDLLTFTLTFAPTTPGRTLGRLRIGNDVFDLVSNAIGQRLLYSYFVDGTARDVDPGGTMVFAPTTVSESSTLTIQIRNSGTSATSIGSIGVSSASAFRLRDVPQLPVRLDPDASITFNAVFSPTTTGSTTTPLLIDSQTFTLSGLGNPPPPIPRTTFTGASGTQEPLRQPAVGLTLAQPYPLPLKGTLEMSVEGDGFSGDPAVQFASGGRSVPFTIAANATQAEFTPGSNQARFQTGSVASTITIKPTFSTNSGLDLTPDSPTLLRLNVARSAPVILNVQISTRASDSLTFLINGFTTSRSLTRLDFTFTPVTGSRLAADKVTVNLETDAGAYFRTTSSTAFGGQFSVTMPFNFRSSASTTTTTTTTSPVDQIQSVSVTATNELGTSAAVSRDIR